MTNSSKFNSHCNSSGELQAGLLAGLNKMSGQNHEKLVHVLRPPRDAAQLAAQLAAIGQNPASITVMKNPSESARIIAALTFDYNKINN